MSARTFAPLVAALCLVWCAGPVRTNDDKDQPLMKRKLASAHRSLEAIATNDFEKLVAAGNELADLSRSKDWKILRTPAYELFSAEFERAAERMARQGRAKNTDGAALAYVDLALTCVKCHQHVRETRNARLDVPAADGIGQ